MTYKDGVKYAAVLGVPALIFDLLVRMPPLYHMEWAHSAAEIVLAPGWQVVHVLTGGLVARNFEYKLLMPLLIVGINLMVWGALIWSLANALGRKRRPSAL